MFARNGRRKAHRVLPRWEDHAIDTLPIARSRPERTTTIIRTWIASVKLATRRRKAATPTRKKSFRRLPTELSTKASWPYWSTKLTATAKRTAKTFSTTTPSRRNATVWTSITSTRNLSQKWFPTTRAEESFIQAIAISTCVRGRLALPTAMSATTSGPTKCFVLERVRQWAQTPLVATETAVSFPRWPDRALPCQWAATKIPAANVARNRQNPAAPRSSTPRFPDLRIALATTLKAAETTCSCWRARSLQKRCTRDSPKPMVEKPRARKTATPLAFQSFQARLTVLCRHLDFDDSCRPVTLVNAQLFGQPACHTNLMFPRNCTSPLASRELAMDEGAWVCEMQVRANF